MSLDIILKGPIMENVAAAPPGRPAARPPAEIFLVFASNTEVLNAEDLLEEAGLDFELAPVPKEVNPNCGLALSFGPASAPAVGLALARAGFGFVAAYLRRGDGFSPLEDELMNFGLALKNAPPPPPPLPAAFGAAAPA